MKRERIVLSFIAVCIGIAVSALAFYLYQSTKVLSPAQQNTVSVINPKPSPKSSLFLSIDTPNDEDVVQTRTVKVTGKTTRDATLLVVTATSEQVLIPSANGDFATTVTIAQDANTIEIVAIAPNAEEVHEVRTVTYSTESF